MSITPLIVLAIVVLALAIDHFLMKNRHSRYLDNLDDRIRSLEDFEGTEKENAKPRSMFGNLQ